MQGDNNKETARMDQLSHYILRLSYCGKPELRKWFLAQVMGVMGERGAGSRGRTPW